MKTKENKISKYKLYVLYCTVCIYVQCQQKNLNEFEIKNKIEMLNTF